LDAHTLGEVMGWTLSESRYQELLPSYLKLMEYAEINNVNRAAMLAAQLGHESVGLKYQAEIWGPSAAQLTYKGRMGNRPGTTDWSDFRGHGWIQISGRNNHTNCSRWAYEQGIINDPDLFVNHPEKLGHDEYVWIGPAWYWTVARPTINKMSDAGDLEGVTRAINGGTNGIADRRVRYNRALPIGERLLHDGVANPGKRMHEFLMDYTRDHVTQQTPWNCGPASTETAILAATGNHVHESDLAVELGTHRGGTDWIGQFPEVLNRHIPDGEYTYSEMPNDPPTQEQEDKLWTDLTASLDAGHPPVINIVAPPSNYPQAVSPSTVSPAYAGGTIYHYIAALGYAGTGAGRRVWIADSGFQPFGYWIGFDQLTTLIPQKGYAHSTAPAKFNQDEPEQTFLEDLMASTVPSFVNPDKEFTGSTSLALIDRATWENRVLIEALFTALGLDADAVVEKAIAADREG